MIKINWIEKEPDFYIDPEDRLDFLTGRKEHRHCTEPCNLYTEESVQAWIDYCLKRHKELLETYHYWIGTHGEEPGSKWYVRTLREGKSKIDNKDSGASLLLKSGKRCR